jgi:hypothetical protein
VVLTPRDVSDPQLSTAKRQQRSQALSSHMATASLERQLLTAQTARAELESKLREKEVVIEKLERDRRWLAEREKTANEEKDQERAEYDESKASRGVDISFDVSVYSSCVSFFVVLFSANMSMNCVSFETQRPSCNNSMLSWRMHIRPCLGNPRIASPP